MNSHDIDIELPPLPEARIVSYQTDSTMRRMELRTYSDKDMRDYARAAIEADRKQRSITKPSTNQDWLSLDPAVAFHLIERHAENWNDAGAMMQAYLDAHIEADRKRRGEPVDVPDALRQIAGWMDDGGPSKHEAEMIGMELSGPVGCSSHQACTKAAKLAFLEAARIWEHINPIAPQPAEPERVPSDDALTDALNNLEHDNYEQSYSGYKNRQADVELIRAALTAQAHEAAPAAQQPATCQGTNCGATSGQEHSPECILEAAEVQGWSDSPEADNARRMLAAPRDSLHDCALGDSNYAAGMLLGWNLCTDGRDEDFRRIREDRLRAAASASKEAQEVASAAQQGEIAWPAIPATVRRDVTMLAGYAEGSKSAEIVNTVRRVIDWLNADRIAAQAQEAAPAAQQPLTDEHKAILKECRNQAMRWTLEARIPEAGAFGGIAQDLDYLCGQLGIKND